MVFGYMAKKMMQQVLQRIRVIRRVRIRQSRVSAAVPKRQHHQRVMRLLSGPVLLLTMMTFLYLFGVSSTIELGQLLESVTVPQHVNADSTQMQPVVDATMVPAIATIPIVMMTATPAPIVPTDLPAPVVVQSGRISSIRIPAIGVDSRVIEVGWERVLNAAGESELVWQVAKFAVGHHFTSAAPGDADNIVLSAHVGGYGRIFARLNELRPNDEIVLVRNNQAYAYQVHESIYVNEANATESEQIANLSYINATGREMVTLVTCWPPSGPDRFSQRLIVRAWPVGSAHE